MSEGKVIASVASYRSKIEIPVEVTLPSGSVFVLRRLTPVSYLKAGLKDIPNEFFKFIREISSEMTDDQLNSEEAKKNFEVFDNFLRITITQGVVNPPMLLRYEEDKQDTHLLFSELTIEDQKFVTDFITGKLTLGK